MNETDKKKPEDGKRVCDDCGRVAYCVLTIEGTWVCPGCYGKNHAAGCEE